MATTANPYTGFDPYNQAPQPDVSIVDLPTDNTPVTVIDNPTAQQEVSIVNPATANQNIQGPAQQAKVQPASPTTTNLPSQQPTIKTNQQDVVNTFQRLLGRAPNMTPGSQDYNNVLEMTKMSPQEVEKSLQATRDSIVGAQAKPASSSKQEAPKQETTVSGEPAVTPGSQEGDWQIFADGSKYNSKTGEVIGKDGVSSLAKAEGEKATETDLMDDWAASVKTEVDSANKELDAFGVTLSESAKRQIEDIKKSFEIRKAQQAIINKALLGGTAVSGMVSGRARYARDIQQSILSAEESAGIARLTALDVEERKLIEEAKTALEEKQFSLLEKKRANLLKVLDAKKEALIESAKMAKEQEELVINKMKAMQDQFNADRTYELETKKYELSERTAADKAALDKAQLDVSIAGLTGKYYDEPTLAAKKQAADEAFRMLGYELDEKEFDEMRANNTFNQKIALRKVELAESQAEAEKMGIDVVDTAQKIMDGTLKYSDVVAKEKAPVTRALNAALSNQREAFTEAYKTTGNAYYSIKSSAGGKQVVSSTEMLLSKMFGSQQSLDVVKSVFDEAAAKGKTGAFKGRITDLKFWDQDKAAIDAALAAVIPTIARGVFMEVGVLTDNDINNYKRAIADIKTPEGKRDAIFYTLMSNIAGKVSTTLTSNSNSGFDVSKYAYDYDKLVSELARKIPKDIKDKTSFPSTAKSLNPMFYDSIDDMQKNLDTTGAWQGYFDTVIAPYAKDNRITYEEAFDDMKEAKRQEKLMKGITFNQVGSDTNKAVISKLSTKQDGAKGGQCGRFVNQITGLGVGDSYQSKMSKMDPTITKPEPGMVFTMPYKDTGHIGFIVGIDGDQAIVKDSNYSLDEKIKTHKIALSKITGLARV